MQNSSIEKFSGRVEADETFIGGLARNMHKSKKKHLGTGGAGKVRVIAWNSIISTEPFENVEIIPTKAQKYAEIGHYERFLTQDALDSIRPHTAQLLGNVKLELVIEDDEEPSAH